MGEGRGEGEREKNAPTSILPRDGGGRKRLIPRDGGGRKRLIPRDGGGRIKAWCFYYKRRNCRGNS